MASSDDAPCSGLHAGKAVRLRLVLMAGLTAVALAGCGMGGDAGALMVDPSRYDGYHCSDLVLQWKALLKREKDLRELIDRADAGSTVIATLTYRTDYDTVLGEKKILQRTAAEKNCVLVSAYQSDQTIH